MSIKTNSLDLFIYVLIFCLIFIASSISYYFFVSLPVNEKQILEAKQKEQQLIRDEKIRVQNGYKYCLDIANINYSRNWNSSCKPGELSVDCTRLINISVEEYMKKYNITDLFQFPEHYNNATRKCTCNLSSEDSTKWNTKLKNDTEECEKTKRLMSE